MTDFYVRWGDDVQPYIRQLASEHIDTLRDYCHETIGRILTARRRRRAVHSITVRVKQSMMKGKAFHCFKMFGFDFELREGTKKQPKARKQEYILNFSAEPDFDSGDMPPRLRRVDGKPLTAVPAVKRRPRAVAPTRAQGSRKGSGKKREVERISYRLRGVSLWIGQKAAVLASSLAAKLYKMRSAYQRLSARIAATWRRRPRLGLVTAHGPFLTYASEPDVCAPTHARLEPRLLGESLRFLLFTFVSEPAVDWSAYPFGRLAEQGERRPV
jgi:hypothetical protein